MFNPDYMLIHCALSCREVQTALMLSEGGKSLPDTTPYFPKLDVIHQVTDDSISKADPSVLVTVREIRENYAFGNPSLILPPEQASSLYSASGGFSRQQIFADNPTSQLTSEVNSTQSYPMLSFLRIYSVPGFTVVDDDFLSTHSTGGSFVESLMQCVKHDTNVKNGDMQKRLSVSGMNANMTASESVALSGGLAGGLHKSLVRFEDGYYHTDVLIYYAVV